MFAALFQLAGAAADKEVVAELLDQPDIAADDLEALTRSGRKARFVSARTRTLDARRCVTCWRRWTFRSIRAPAAAE
ncbi:MAG: hypothetical protein R3D70_00085 [Rhizobiaceae bacterium]